eukprot:6197461-Pleurochrysis_carterae.AAC.3
MATQSLDELPTDVNQIQVSNPLLLRFHHRLLRARPPSSASCDSGHALVVFVRHRVAAHVLPNEIEGRRRLPTIRRTADPLKAVQKQKWTRTGNNIARKLSLTR